MVKGTSHFPYINGNFDYSGGGKVLANLFFFLSKQKEIYSVSVKMPLKLTCDVTYNPPKIYQKEKDIDFYHDKSIEEIDLVNETLLNMDETDINIVILLENGAKYETIADACYRLIQLNIVLGRC